VKLHRRKLASAASRHHFAKPIVLMRWAIMPQGEWDEPAAAAIAHRSGLVTDKPIKDFLEFFIVLLGGSDFGNPQ
jgi:hypothetical protein